MIWSNDLTRMKKQYHILNGDALREQFPKTIQGEIIVVRECLVEGNVQGKKHSELFVSRAAFLSQNYGGTLDDYYGRVASEFERINTIEDEAEVNLWFEDDLFCQVNFWFVTSLLVNQNQNNKIFLVRPNKLNEYGFGGLSESELVSFYSNRIPLVKLSRIASLWILYQENRLRELIAVAREMETLYPFILVAVEAHIDRSLNDEVQGRPIKSLVQIMADLKTKEFGPVFREFCSRESVYGFGDLQVKRLFDIAVNIK